MIIDFRTKKNVNDMIPTTINNQKVEVVKSYKYLGFDVEDDLKVGKHVTKQIKKANKRMYHVRCLSKLRIDSKIISMFYNSVLSSVLTYAISCWFTRCTTKEKKSLDKFRKKVCKLVNKAHHNSIFNVYDVHVKQCLALLDRILKDQSHPLHSHFKFLPSGERLNVTALKSNRAKNTFVPTAIKLFNLQ